MAEPAVLRDKCQKKKVLRQCNENGQSRKKLFLISKNVDAVIFFHFKTAEVLGVIP